MNYIGKWCDDHGGAVGLFVADSRKSVVTPPTTLFWSGRVEAQGEVGANSTPYQVLIRDFRPDIVVACFGRDIIALLVRRLVGKLLSRDQDQLPLLCVIQAVPIHLESASAFSNRLRKFGAALCYRHVNRVFCVSEAVGESVRSLGQNISSFVEVLPNPVVHPEIIALAAKFEEEDPWRGMSGCRIVAVGRLHKQKGYGTLLRAVKLLASETGIEVALVIVGDGPERAALTLLADNLGIGHQVRLIGFRSNPYPTISKSDIFVLSSNWEGLPSVLIEAMYLKRPVIATDCVAGPREILEGGKWGRLVPVGDAASLAKAIEETMRDPGDLDGPKTRSLLYSCESAAARYSESLRSLVGSQ